MYKTFAVILNWNNAEDTVKCVDSILQAQKIPDKIVVVDNGSTDNSDSILRAKLNNNCHLIQTRDNLGYAGGMRVGADYCLTQKADLIWFLNNDTVILPDTLNNLLASVERNGLDYMYSPKILYLSDHNRVYFAGFYLNPNRGTFGGRPKSRPIEHGADKSDLISDVIQGASFLAPVKIIREFGFMDENFFLYWEEFDYSLRLAQHGIKFICVLSAVIFHKREGTPSSSPKMLERIRAYYRARNQIICWKRCFKPEQVRQFIKAYFLEQIKLSLNFKSRQNTTKFLAICLGCWHGLIGKTGRIYQPK